MTDWLIQLSRAATLFRQLLESLKLNYLVQPHVVFINPDFTLYNAPMEKSIILPTQVNRFLADLNKTPSKLNHGHQHLAQQLLSLHKTKNPYMKLPEYRYGDLRKGNCCRKCGAFELIKQNYDFLCLKCGERERISSSIFRSTKEFQLLFPEEKVTTSAIYDWCNSGVSKKTISRILSKNFIATGNTSNTYYL